MHDFPKLPRQQEECPNLNCFQLKSVLLLAVHTYLSLNFHEIQKSSQMPSSAALDFISYTGTFLLTVIHAYGFRQYGYIYRKKNNIISPPVLSLSYASCDIQRQLWGPLGKCRWKALVRGICVLYPGKTRNGHYITKRTNSGWSRCELRQWVMVHPDSKDNANDRCHGDMVTPLLIQRKAL